MSSEESEGYAEGTPFVELLGDRSRAKILFVFASQRDREFNIAQLARQAGTTRKTVYEHIDDFAELGIVRERQVKQGTRYSYNEESEVAQKLYELNGAILGREYELREDVEIYDC